MTPSCRLPSAAPTDRSERDGCVGRCLGLRKAVEQQPQAAAEQPHADDATEIVQFLGRQQWRSRVVMRCAKKVCYLDKGKSAFRETMTLEW